jgi:dTDP-glucose pyrophosphorylase
MTKKIKKNEYLDMTFFINRLLKNKVKITACPLHESWLDIGMPGDYKKAND